MRHIYPLFVFALLFMSNLLPTNAQIATPVECGYVGTDEITANFPTFLYGIDLTAGETITISVMPTGDGLAPIMRLYVGGRMTEFRTNGFRGRSQSIENFGVSSTGLHEIEIEASSDTTGQFTLSIGCILEDGTIINPGDVLPSAVDTVPPSMPEPVAPLFGFPGLASVDFINATKDPLIIGTAMTKAITPTGSEIFGFTLDANANDKLDLSVNRLSGNLNLGVVILSADNKVVFYGGLITSESLSTRLTLPTAGQYTIGVFRVDLLPPDAPEATAFQVTGTLNP